MAQLRLKDWSDIGAGRRPEMLQFCRDVARVIQGEVSPFVQISEAVETEMSGPLAGLPYAAKDMFLSPGRKPSWGLAEPLGSLPETKKADVLCRLDKAGARRVGFTRMTTLAYEPSGINPLQGAACNPWNRDFAPGASSSGSAVAVASGATFVALGSDTGGSLRIPAQGCGITAWKPTHGFVSDMGAMPLAPSLDTIGLLARSARDILSVAPILSGQLGQRKPNLRPASIAIISDALEGSHPAVRSCCEAALEAMRTIGHMLEARTGLDLINNGGSEALTVMQAEAAKTHEQRLDDANLDTVLVRRLRKGFEIRGAKLEASLKRRADLLKKAHDEIFGVSNMIALPVMPIRTPPLSETDPTSPGFAPRTLYAFSTYSRFVNYLGLPAIALPVGFDDRGMPVALQLIGRRGSDLDLLSTAATFQTATDWHGRLPTTLQPVADIYGDLLS